MQRSNTRFIIIALIITAVVAAVMWQMWMLSHLRAQLSDQADDIAQRYDNLVDETMPSLQASHHMDANLTRIASHIEESRAQMLEAQILDEKVRSISRVQSSVTNFITEGAKDANVAADPAFHKLENDMGEHGDVRELLQTYNTTARRWNMLVQGTLGSLTASITGSPKNLLPYLRFDGEYEYIPVISL